METDRENAGAPPPSYASQTSNQPWMDYKPSSGAPTVIPAVFPPTYTSGSSNQASDYKPSSRWNDPSWCKQQYHQRCKRQRNGKQAVEEKVGPPVQPIRPYSANYGSQSTITETSASSYNPYADFKSGGNYSKFNPAGYYERPYYGSYDDYTPVIRCASCFQIPAKVGKMTEHATCRYFSQCRGSTS
jgi:hypothetical protein